MKNSTIFRTPIDIEKMPFQISHSNKLMFIGSCFTENIGQKIEKLKFTCDINPFGIIYDPLSILFSLNRLLNPSDFVKEDLFFRNGLWNSYRHHSRFSHQDISKTLNGINSRLQKSSEFLKSCDFLFITLGTARIYNIAASNELVANCHKVPAKFFTTTMLDSNEIISEFKKFFAELKYFNPKIKIIFTVSPIRHLKYGIQENSLSKSTLINAVHKICLNTENAVYFPAYEIMLDDLRDYRFYEQDMIHPTQTAQDYIFELFSQIFFNDESSEINAEITKILKSIEHKPFNINTPEYMNFLDKTLDNIKILANRKPSLDFLPEIETLIKIKNRLNI
jgi:hypothetical protein